MENLNLDAVEQQQIIITVAVNNSDGTPADLTQYACYAASVGQQDPYTRRAPRKEWAAAINNECSAYLLTAPGLEMADAPWRYSIYLKDRKLGLEWVICTGRITLTPRACGTDGISPAAYSISAECTPSGLVNVSLDATVGSISGTLEEVKAAAALASSSAANAHADLEDARKAATTAAQAATTAAADAKTAADAATRAEQAATDAPQACAPFVGQVQAAAVQAQQAATHAEEDANRASTAATTATEKAQVATDAAAAAAASATDLASARDTAVQASTAAQAAQQTAQLASTTATTAAENAREYAEDAQQAKQAAATSESNSATAAQQASASASAAAVSAQSAQASAATAVSAKSDLETARDTAVSAATTATDAATAAATSETNATAAATAATAAQTAAEAAQAQADTDARACAIYDQRVAANAAAASDSAATAAAAAETATDAANTATDAANTATDAANTVNYDYVGMVWASTRDIQDGITYAGLKGDGTYKFAIVKNVTSGVTIIQSDIVITHGECSFAVKQGSVKIFWSEDAKYIPLYAFRGGIKTFIHAPKLTVLQQIYGAGSSTMDVVFSPATKFEYVKNATLAFWGYGGALNLADGTTFSALENANRMFSKTRLTLLSDNLTFESVKNASGMFDSGTLTNLPASTNLSKCTICDNLTFSGKSLEVDDIVRVCLTLPDLTALAVPKTCPVGIARYCKHNGEVVSNTAEYIAGVYPDFITTMTARGWTVTFV